MSALAVIGATQITPGMAPKTLNTGGTSKSDPNAGIEAPHDPYSKLSPIGTADKAGAAILTFFVLSSLIGLCVWIML